MVLSFDFVVLLLDLVHMLSEVVEFLLHGGVLCIYRDLFSHGERFWLWRKRLDVRVFLIILEFCYTEAELVVLLE